MAKKRVAKVLSILVLVFLAIAVIFFIKFAYGSYTTHNIKNYLNDKYYCDFYAEKFMPQIDSLKDYDDIDFTYYRKNYSEFTANAYTLAVKYNEENYMNAKETTFNEYWVSDDKMTHNNSDIRLCYDSEFDYPRNFGMIGYDDENRVITYLFFFDEGNTNDDINWILNEYFLM